MKDAPLNREDRVATLAAGAALDVFQTGARLEAESILGELESLSAFFMKRRARPYTVLVAHCRGGHAVALRQTEAHSARPWWNRMLWTPRISCMAQQRDNPA